MADDLATTAALAYETYRTACAGTVAGGLPMPMWEQLSVPERAAWLAVAAAMTGTDAPAPEAAQLASSPPGPCVEEPPASSPTLWTQADLEQLTVSDLRELAQEQHVSVSSSATKQQLIDALLGFPRGTQEG